MMIVGMFGAGSLGSAVGQAIAAGGHHVILSSRHPERLNPGPNQAAATLAECARRADVLMLATPYRALPSLAKELLPLLDGKVVIDATNPEPGDHDALSEEARRDGMGVVTQRYLPSSRVVRAFSSINAWNVVRSRSQPEPLAVSVAGDDPDAVGIVEELVHDAACVPVVTGDLASGRTFEWGGPGCFVNTNEAGLRALLGL